MNDAGRFALYEEALSLAELTVPIVEAIGYDDDEFNERERPDSFDSHIRYDLISSIYKIGLNQLFDNKTDEQRKIEFQEKYRKQLYKSGADSNEKDEVISGVVRFIDDLQSIYHLTGLLQIDVTKTGIDRLAEASIRATGNDLPLDLIQFIRQKQEQRLTIFESESDENENEDEDDDQESAEISKEDSVDDSINDELNSILEMGLVGDFEVEFKVGRVVTLLGKPYQISNNALIIPKLENLQLTSSEIMFDLRRFFSHFNQFGSFSLENIFDFTTLVALLAQNVAFEQGGIFGNLSRKKNHIGMAERQTPIFPVINKETVLKVNDGDKYWFLCEQLLKTSNLDNGEVIDECERMFALLVDWLDLGEVSPDNQKVKPVTIQQQNITFRLLDNKLMSNDILSLAYSCEVNQIVKRAVNMRDQIRTLVSSIMIRVAFGFEVVKEDRAHGRSMRVWTLFPFKLTNDDYHRTDLRSLLVMLRIIESSII